MDNTRRSLLKLIAGASGVPALGSTNEASHSKDVDVIIIGAGMAGLHGAKELVSRGFNVLILEASSRHGGRIYSETLGETRVELGAEEHYLKENNPIYEAITNALGEDAYVTTYDGETLISMDSGNTCWQNDGSCYKDPDINRYWDYWEVLDDPLEQTDFSLTMADDVLIRYGIDKDHRAYHLFDHGIAGSVYGASLDQIGSASLAKQDDKWTLSGSTRGLAPKNIGYVDILDQVWWGDVLNRVRFDNAVTKIETTAQGVEITDINGERYSAKKTIITVSVGVLQNEIIEFVPALPEQTINAYTNIGMGSAMKIVLRFKEAFWDPNMTNFLSEGLSSTGWIPSSYKKDTTDNLIMCYPTGSNADTLNAMAQKAGSGTKGDNAIIAAMLDDLDQILGGKATEHYVDGLVQNWTGDPYVRGSYSYPMLDTYSSSKSLRQQLAEPVANRLFFAGEATNDQNPACVPGALAEGARAAMQVAKLL